MTTQYNDTLIPWGPSGKVVFDRTYSRTTATGGKETWPETANRVSTGNLALVYGPKSEWTEEVWHEYDRLMKYLVKFAIIPAGRHLWASGVRGRQYLFNCHHSGWTDALSRHFSFQMTRLFEGGGVGANYSMSRIGEQHANRTLKLHIVCDPDHPDYAEMQKVGLLSADFTSDWPGSFDVEDTREGWAAATIDLIDTYTTSDYVLHEDRVYDVSRVRRKGSRLKSSGGTASGPLPLAEALSTIEQTLNAAYQRPSMDGLITGMDCMDIDHATAAAVVAGGTRRSARMSVMHWKDPYIFDFLKCKEDPSKHWTTNISVEIDQEFIDMLHAGEFVANRAVAVHQAVVSGMLTNGEPGYWNSTASNVGEVDEVTCTNPCGEIALVEFENCNLGHVNLDAFAPTRKGGPVNRLGLDEAHMLMTRFLIRATFGDVNDEEQARLLVRNRRIGVGHLGVQGYLAKRGIKYSEANRSKFPRELRDLYSVVRTAAREYAFDLRITEPVKVTTVAPTGSVAKLAGATEGIHPVLFRHYLQGIRFNIHSEETNAVISEAMTKGYNVETCQYDKTGNTIFIQYPTKHQLVAEVEALGYPASIVEIASEISLEDMLLFQAMYQQNYADNAVSFTANVAAEKHQREHMMSGSFDPMPPPTTQRLNQVSEIIKACLPNLKGTTLMLDGARPQSPYTLISEADFALYEMSAQGDGIDENCASGACPTK